MSNVTIFKQGGAASPRKELSDLAKSLLSSGGTFRRIQTNTNGTFKRLVNGLQGQVRPQQGSHSTRLLV